MRRGVTQYRMMPLTAGTVNISREFLDHPAFATEAYTEREAWLWLIMEARWKAGQKRVGRKVFDVDRGQLVASMDFMAKAWKWSKARVFRFLKRLEKLEMICSKSETDATLVTICNYDKFQGERNAGETLAKRWRNELEEGGNKGERKEEDIFDAYAPNIGQNNAISQPERPKRQPKRRPECELPEGWVPNDRNIQDAQKKGLTDAQIDREAEQFRNWHGSKQNRYRDWDAAWRTWIGNAVTRGARSGRHVNSANATMDAIAIAARARPTPIPDRW